jgi:quercetin dioxygenase-like cupin family protein
MLKTALPLIALVLLAAPAAERKSFTIQASQIAWQPLHIPGFPDGLQQRLLHDNKDNKLQSAIVKYPKGFREPRHYHTTCGHSIYILKGRLRAPEGDLVPGTFTYAAVNERHGPFMAVEETEIYFYTDGPFDMKIEDKKP